MRQTVSEPLAATWREHSVPACSSCRAQSQRGKAATRRCCVYGWILHGTLFLCQGESSCSHHHRSPCGCHYLEQESCCQSFHNFRCLLYPDECHCSFRACCLEDVLVLRPSCKQLPTQEIGAHLWQTVPGCSLSMLNPSSFQYLIKSRLTHLVSSSSPSLLKLQRDWMQIDHQRHQTTQLPAKTSLMHLNHFSTFLFTSAAPYFSHEARHTILCTLSTYRPWSSKLCSGHQFCL